MGIYGLLCIFLLLLKKIIIHSLVQPFCKMCIFAELDQKFDTTFISGQYEATAKRDS